MSTYSTPSSSRHPSYVRQSSAYNPRGTPSVQSGFLSYSANHRKVNPPQPLSLRPISTATSINVDSDYDSYSEGAVCHRDRRTVGSNARWQQAGIKEESEVEEVSDAESMESLSSRARYMHDILSDSDSMHSRTRTSISSFSEAATPEPSPLPQYGEPVIYDPDAKNPMIFRHSMTYAEDLPRYSRESISSTVGPKGPHLFRSLSLNSTAPVKRLASTADFIPPTPITPIDFTEMELPPFPAIGMQHQVVRPPSPIAESQRTPSPTVSVPILASPRTPSSRQQSPMLTAVPQFPASPAVEERPFNPERDIRPLSTVSAAVLNDYGDDADISMWSPQQICVHLAAVGFDKTIVQKFAQNDISGQILIDLKWEDLKELDIQSFGKRVELWSEIHHLRSRSSGSSAGPVEQFAYRPESRATHVFSSRSTRPSPALSTARVPRTPRAPAIETLQAIAFAETEDEEELQAQDSSDDADEGTTIAIKLVRNPTRRRRVNSRRVTHARLPKRGWAAESTIDVTDVTEDEHTDAYRVRAPKKKNVPSSKQPKAPRRQELLAESVAPGDSISVVGCKQKTCKAHKNAPKCKKGERCGKHGKMAKRARERSSNSGTILIAATPSITEPMTLPPFSTLDLPSRPISMDAASVLASSDVLGPGQRSEIKLEEAALKDIVRMDPAENVKQFLIHQHIQQLEERRKSLEDLRKTTSAPEIGRGTPVVGSRGGTPVPENFHTDGNAPEPECFPVSGHDSPSDNQQATVVPQIQQTPIRRKPVLGLRTSNIGPAPPGSTTFSPLQGWRTRSSMLRSGTPFSEMDVSFRSGTPSALDFRNQSASVPPDMNYGMSGRQASVPGFPARLVAPAPPPPGALISRRGAQSATGIRPNHGHFNMASVDESGEWEDANDQPTGTKATAKGDLSVSSSLSTGGINSSIRVHSGWMRKRKTNWFRHEWPEHHFVLRGTRLGMHKDQHSAEEGAIEMDDYQVACSNSTSTKLSAAFKSWKIKNGQGNAVPEGAFFFQLVPSTEKEKRLRGIATSSSKGEKKVHYFAVKSRDERIEWMRELMIAKAIKQKGQGFTVEVNGEKV